MPELPFYNNRPAGAHSKPLCAHPAGPNLWLGAPALAGSQAYPERGLSDQAFKSGWANVQANNYWSSSAYANNPTNAWNVNMWNGNVNGNNKTNAYYVWPVRAGEWGKPSHPNPPQGERESMVSPPLMGGDKGDGGIFSFENLYRQYLKCRRNKRNTINALKFEINAEENLFKLSEELANKSYKPARSVCFIVERPKMREIIAADFQDRVAHHVLIERLEAIYEPIFIYDSYACRKDKGLHKAVGRIREFVRRCGENGRKRLYFIHLDIRNFFMTIDKNILFEILKKKVNDEDLLWLARLIIFRNPTRDCIIKGKGHLINCLPAHKSLFQAGENRGLPIGNLTSQFFANLYLNELDQYAKHTLKCKYYVRYCDDFLILDDSSERLKEIKKSIGEFVSVKLGLSLNDKHGKALPVSNGIDFLGYIIRQDYMLVRRRVVNNLKSRLDWFEKRLISKKHGMKVTRYDYELLESLRSVLASYLGHMKWADTYNLKRSLLRRYSFLKEYFSFDDDRVNPLYKYCEIFPSVKSQYLYYTCRFRGAAVFLQVGCFYELYNGAKEDVMAILGLEGLKQNTRGVRYGFPLRLEGEYVKKIIEKEIPVIIIKETDRYIGRIKQRLPAMKITKIKEE